MLSIFVIFLFLERGPARAGFSTLLAPKGPGYSILLAPKGHGRSTLLASEGPGSSTPLLALDGSGCFSLLAQVS